MNGFFSLIEQLISLSAPSIVILQSLLGTTLEPVPNKNKYWHFYEGNLATGLIALVDYRVPIPGATKPAAPFLVLRLRDAPINIDDLRERYGKGHPTDISVHHPSFVGYSFSINGCPIGVKVDSKTEVVISISIDYSDQVVKKGGVQRIRLDCESVANQRRTPADPFTIRPSG